MNERIFRENTRPVQVGNLTIGGSEELTIQSMTTTKTHDVEATVAEIHRLEEAGCQIVRVACLMNVQRMLLVPSRKRFIFRLWQIFILITD